MCCKLKLYNFPLIAVKMILKLYLYNTSIVSTCQIPTQVTFLLCSIQIVKTINILQLISQYVALKTLVVIENLESDC